MEYTPLSQLRGLKDKIQTTTFCSKSIYLLTYLDGPMTFSFLLSFSFFPSFSFLPSLPFLSYFKSILLCLYVHMHTHIMSVWWLEDNFWESVLPFTVILTRRSLTLHSKHFNLLSFWAGPCWLCRSFLI